MYDPPMYEAQVWLDGEWRTRMHGDSRMYVENFCYGYVEAACRSGVQIPPIRAINMATRKVFYHWPLSFRGAEQ